MGHGAGRLSMIGLAAALLLGELPPVAAQNQRESCTLLNVAGPSFGEYDYLDPTPSDATGNITLRCDALDAGRPIRIELGRGRRGTVRRALTLRGRKLDYNLYLDVARTLIWGDGNRGTGAFQANLAPGVELSVPVYGRLPSGQSVPPGTYTDQIRVIVQH